MPQEKIRFHSLTSFSAFHLSMSQKASVFTHKLKLETKLECFFPENVAAFLT